MRFISGIVVSLVLTSYAYADCNPKDFLISDINKYALSDKVKISAYSVIDKSSNKQNSKNAGATIPVDGIPVNATMSEASAISNKALAKSGFSLDSQYNLSVVNTALSSVGANMYADCIGAQNVKVIIPSVAYDDDNFIMTIKWTPKYNHPDIGNAKIAITNGLIDSKDSLITTFKPQEAKTFIIKNNSSVKARNYLQIAATIDGQSSPVAVIPPPTPIRKYKLVQRTGQALHQTTIGGNTCTTEAYLVSEVGSRVGNYPKSCKLCVTASPDGVLLPSTAKLHKNLSARGAYADIDTDINMLMACATFRTSGAGKGSGRFEVYKGGNTFTIFEAVPY